MKPLLYHSEHFQVFNEAPATLTDNLLMEITANHKTVFKLKDINWQGWLKKISNYLVFDVLISQQYELEIYSV